MGDIIVKKARITPVGYMKILYVESYDIDVGPGGLQEEREKKCLVEFRHDPHADLFKAFDGLKFHMAYLTKQAPSIDLDLHVKKEKTHPVLLEMKVTSFSLGGSDDHSGITITGLRQLDNGKVLNINTPFTKYQNEHEPYLYGIDLESAVRECVEEVILYIEGKCAPVSAENRYEQTVIPFGEDDYSRLTEDIDEGFEDEMF